MFNAQNTQQLSRHSTKRQHQRCKSLPRHLPHPAKRVEINAYDSESRNASFCRLQQRERVFHRKQADPTAAHRLKAPLGGLAGIRGSGQLTWVQSGSVRSAPGVLVSVQMAVGGTNQPACSASVAFAILNRRPCISFVRTQPLKQVGHEMTHNSYATHKRRS